MNTVFKDFDNAKEAFFNPRDCQKRVDGFPEIRVSTFSESVIEKFAEMEGVEVIASLYSANGIIPVYKIKYCGKEIAFFLSRVGAPACVCGLEEIIAMGAQKIILFGSCGILDKEAADGRIIVPVAAVRDEGTSYHYLPSSEEVKVGEAMIDKICGCLKKCGYPYVKGKVWTTDGIYRETRKAIDDRRAQGCIAVEMEFAAAAAVTEFRSIPFVQFLYGEDNLDSAEWEPRGLFCPDLSRTEKYMVLAFECGLAI